MKTETIDTMETILFTDIVKKRVTSAPMFIVAPIITYVAIDYGLNPTTTKGFETIKKIIINSVIKN